ncbi:hypothetical protein [Psychrobacillus antarcticus]|uniref:hypothetical protein n=1 Tax=Psychrobacillus antarcticus TaxID=2879115 RepID=UPI002407C077|nr:hypothetical protein [Psychrobacillus antarcticus]
MGKFELDTLLDTQYLRIEVLKEDELRLCSELGNIMNEGYYFEYNGTHNYSRNCLEKVVTWEEYLAIYDEGNGDAYWSSWE